MNRYYRQFKRKIAAAIVFTLIFSSPLIAQETIEGVARIKVSEALATQLEARSFSRSSSGQIITGVQSVDQLNSQFNVRRFTRVFPHAGKNEARHRRHGLHLWYEVSLDKHIPVSQLIRSYQSEAQILKAEPVYKKANFGKQGAEVVIIEKLHAGSPLPEASNDPLLVDQWHYNNTGQTGGNPGADIRLFGAWKTETGSKNVVVAVIDGGVQSDHEDLAANMWVNSGEIRRNGIDDDNNGYIDDIHGYDFANSTAETLPDDHGTHVAGTIAAVSNNGLGVAGVAGGSGRGDGAKLMSCTVFNDDVSGGFAEAYVYSADNGAVISQNSWGYTTPDVFEQVVLDAIDYFIEEAGKDENGRQIGPMNGGIVIFSAGNFSDESKYYPAFYEPVLAVASSTHTDIRAEYSNFGSWVDITAPGGETYKSDNQGVISTLPGNKYGSFMGTSMACPHVSGVAALIVSKFSQTGLRPHALRQRLLQSVDDIGAANAAFAGKLGSGRLNAALALQQNATAPLPVKDLAVLRKDIGEITLTWTSPRDENDFVAEYDVRYSTSPITESNFTKATQATGVLVPQAAGSKEVLTIGNLPGDVLFYFALRSKDFHGNTSPLSNVVSQRSPLAPTIVVRPIEIRKDLLTAGRATKTFTISNTGRGPLEFSMERPGENAFCTVTPLQGSVSPGASATISVTFDASEHYAGTYRQDVLIETNDPQNNTVVVTFTMRVTDNGTPIASVSTSSIDFKSAQIGTTQRKKVMVSNAGSHGLSITAITSDTDAFAAETATPISIVPFHSREISLIFSPVSTGSASGVVTLHTNDPANPTITLDVKGEGLQQAPVVATPEFFNETLTQGTKLSRTMVLRNNGTRNRSFRVEAINNREVNRETENSTAASGRIVARNDSAIDRRERMQERHRLRLAGKSPQAQALARPIAPTDGNKKRSDSHGRKSTSSASERKIYETGFENFPDGPPESEGWYTTHSWTVVSQNPDRGERHLRGTKDVTGQGENVALSPYLFELDDYEYPQYTTASMRINLDRGKGTSWEVVPQDPWSYVATRIRFNADGTLQAMVIDDEYEFHWKKIDATIPSGYFDLAIEYNGFGSDSSGFPTYDLFINNYYVFSGTGLASGIGQVAFVSGIENEGPALDIDEFKLLGGEFIPAFVLPQLREGMISAGQTVNIDLEFDASVMNFGSYESDIVIYLDDVDSLVVPAALTVVGQASIARDLYAVFMELAKGESATRQMKLTNTGGKPITFDLSLSENIEGFTFLPPTGTIPVKGEQIIDINFQGSPGLYESTLILKTDIEHSSRDEIPVDITVFETEAIFSAPSEVKFDIIAGEVTTRNIQVLNGGKNAVTFEIEEASEPWITYDPQHATISDKPMDVAITFDATHVPAGSKEVIITFKTNDIHRPLHPVAITLEVLPGSGSGENVLHEVWTSIPGKDIASIPLTTTPASTSHLSSLETPANIGDQYGSRVRGYIVAPADGTYTFWIASNDNSELWLSSDETVANKLLIASVTGYTNTRQWSKYPTQRSETVNLKADQKYYFEVLHKEGVGSDHLAVGWQLPDGTLERPIPGVRLLPYDDIGNQTPPLCRATGTITRAYWTDVPGAQIADIPLHTTPDGMEALTIFEGPMNVGSQYGARMQGYICPPATGEYYFWIASNDHSELWLSTDADPANKSKIAFVTGATNPREWDKFPSQRSVALTLTKGKTYYVEALHKQGVGSDHLAVGWQLPDGTMERPIAGSHLSPVKTDEAFTDYQTQDQFYALHSEADDIDIEVYPNPVKGEKLSVVIRNVALIPAVEREVSIRQLTGRTVYSRKETCAEGCETEIDIVDYEPGIYILQVRVGNRTFTEKLIVP